MAERNPYAPPQAEVRDAAPDDAGELASRSQRFVGAFLDTIIESIVTLPFALYTNYWQDVIAGTVGYATAYGLSAVGFAVFVAMNGYLLAKRGQTIGKVIVGTRIVDVADGRVPKLVRSLGVRYGTIWLVSLIPFVGGLLSLLDALVIFRRDRRCLHDLIAGTKVVKV